MPANQQTSQPANQPTNHPTTVGEALELYLDEIGKSRASSTLSTYHYTIEKFKATLTERDVPPVETPLAAAHAAVQPAAACATPSTPSACRRVTGSRPSSTRPSHRRRKPLELPPRIQVHND